ncbi:MAG: urease accessory protein UreF [Vicinamibacterales bacterium]
MPLPSLLHLCDSLFPTGGYAHSDGLEAATATGLVATPADVQAWVEGLLAGPLRELDGPAVRLACEHVEDGRPDALEDLDDELYAQRPSASGRDAIRAVGSRLLRTWHRLHPHPFLETLLSRRAGWTLPVAFGAACATSGVPPREAVEAFLYTRVAATASAAMRLMPLGQIDAHAIVARAAERMPGIAAAVMARREAPGAFMPLVDMLAMRHQHVVTRLFRS